VVLIKPVSIAALIAAIETAIAGGDRSG